MKKPHNQLDGKLLKQKVLSDGTARMTVSFYKYVKIENPEIFRDHLFLQLDDLDVLGRIYVAKEGINAQINVPTKNMDLFKDSINTTDFLNGVRLNVAIENKSFSFFKLIVKVRDKIVADGLEDKDFDSSKIGKHLNAKEFNLLTDNSDTILVDMRNHYESEVGHFKNAWCPDVDTFREQLPVVANKLHEQKGKNIVMYCTGGIKCEKASAYLKYKGFENVYQLEGGIINYAKQVNQEGLENKFVGKNFVFDERLGERITNDVIAKCHQCGKNCDNHTNCKNVACNLLFIQCEECKEKMKNTCSKECKTFTELPEDIQKERRKAIDSGIRIFSKGRFLKK